MLLSIPDKYWKASGFISVAIIINIQTKQYTVCVIKTVTCHMKMGFESIPETSCIKYISDDIQCTCVPTGLYLIL
jgi:hypothetical protein